jgi:hypothetical protein
MCCCIASKRRAHSDNKDIFRDQKSVVLLSSNEDPLLRKEDNPALRDALESTKKYQRSYEELRRATDDFAIEIGTGSFARVFEGRLGGVKVAVKVSNPSAKDLSKNRRSGELDHQQVANDAKHRRMLMVQFAAEISTLYKYRHPNMCTLFGHCVDGPTRILVYEHCSNGDLAHRLVPHDLSSTPALTWPQRLHIAVGTARALAHLHSSNPPIVHRDVKPGNILLDANFNAHLCDFATVREEVKEYGSAVKEGRADTHSGALYMCTPILIGTQCYMPPEYVQMGTISNKMDSFALGMCLFELLTAEIPERVELLELVTKGIAVSKGIERGERGIKDMIDPRAIGLRDDEETGVRTCEALLRRRRGREGRSWPLDEAVTFAELGVRCQDRFLISRSTVQEVLLYLEILQKQVEKRCVLAGEGDKIRAVAGKCR